MPRLVFAANPNSMIRETTDGQQFDAAYFSEKNKNAFDIKKAVQIAVLRHPSVMAAEETVHQYANEVDGARAGRNFQLNFSFKAGSKNGVPAKDADNINAVFTVNKMLYDFGRTAGDIEYAKAKEDYVNATYLLQIDDIAATTANAYLDILRYQDYKNKADLEVAAIKRILEIVTLRAEAGISSYADVVQVKARLANAEANLESIKLQLSQQKTRLQDYVGFPISECQEVTEQNLDININEEVIFAALPEYQQVMADSKAAEANYKSLKAQNYPALSLQGEFSKAVSGINLSSYEENGKYSAVYLMLNEPLAGSGMQDKATAAKFAKAAADKKIESLVLEKKIQLSNYKDQIDGYKNMAYFIQQQRDNTKITKELYLDQYMLGKRSILDTLNVEQELYQASVQTSQLNYDVLKTLISYKKEAGQLRSLFNIDCANNNEQEQVTN